MVFRVTVSFSSRFLSCLIGVLTTLHTSSGQTYAHVLSKSTCCACCDAHLLVAERVPLQFTLHPNTTVQLRVLGEWCCGTRRDAGLMSCVMHVARTAHRSSEG